MAVWRWLPWQTGYLFKEVESLKAKENCTSYFEAVILDHKDYDKGGIGPRQNTQLLGRYPRRSVFCVMEWSLWKLVTLLNLLWVGLLMGRRYMRPSFLCSWCALFLVYRAWQQWLHFDSDHFDPVLSQPHPSWPPCNVGFVVYCPVGLAHGQIIHSHCCQGVPVKSCWGYGIGNKGSTSPSCVRESMSQSFWTWDIQLNCAWAHSSKRMKADPLPPPKAQSHH
jgi:hypothetical protein